MANLVDVVIQQLLLAFGFQLRYNDQVIAAVYSCTLCFRVLNQVCVCVYVCRECNGLQLNNQRVLSPPSCSQLPSRQSSFRCQLSRHNSFASSQVSRKNSVNLGRQNSCASGHSPVNGHGHSVVSGQNSLSGSGPAVFTQNNLSSCKVVSIRKRKKSTTLLVSNIHCCVQ